MAEFNLLKEQRAKDKVIIDKKFYKRRLEDMLEKD